MEFYWKSYKNGTEQRQYSLIDLELESYQNCTNSYKCTPAQHNFQLK